jgi:hypothetical protein
MEVCFTLQPLYLVESLRTYCVRGWRAPEHTGCGGKEENLCLFWESNLRSSSPYPIAILTELSQVVIPWGMTGVKYRHFTVLWTVALSNIMIYKYVRVVTFEVLTAMNILICDAIQSGR